ncbi:hypothetical protein BU17DRAFT_64837 [Hysterangium stoloniferum]|nr:hypothetical protein BU17DRAFT_64837 [Hysterangium stoloniferum]
MVRLGKRVKTQKTVISIVVAVVLAIEDPVKCLSHAQRYEGSSTHKTRILVDASRKTFQVKVRTSSVPLELCTLARWMEMQPQPHAADIAGTTGVRVPYGGIIQTWKKVEGHGGTDEWIYVNIWGRL